MLKEIIKKIVTGYKYNNDTFISYLKARGLTIGKDSIFYDPIHTNIDMTSLDFISIGNNVQITSGCTILGHDYSHSVLCNAFNDMPRSQKKTIIGDNVFIGMNTTILMGTKIGDNVIIGAGSVVRGVVESDSVYLGNPAQKVCTLQEYYDKLKDKFNESAKTYFSVRGNDKKTIYSALFEDEKWIKDFVTKNSFKAISHIDTQSLSKNINKTNISYEEFLNKE
ncbi:MAG: acyltransferase [bacterium]|nr:acyltransferase [bacterium]